MLDRNVLERQIHIKAPPETVFSYFTESDKMVQWKGREARLDAQPGGQYWVHLHGDNIVRGEFVEIEPPDRVVFTWGWEGEDSPLPPGASRVEVLFQVQDEGTLLNLRHYDLEDEQLTYQAGGWDKNLPHLVDAIENTNPSKGAD